MLVLLVGSVQLGASGKSGALGSRHTCLCPIREAFVRKVEFKPLHLRGREFVASPFQQEEHVPLLYRWTRCSEATKTFNK